MGFSAMLADEYILIVPFAYSGLATVFPKFAVYRNKNGKEQKNKCSRI